MARGLVLAVLGVLGIGCVDTAGELENFEDRLEASGAGNGDAGPTDRDGAACAVAPGFVEGRYLLALSVSSSPGTPIVATTELSTPAEGGTVQFELLEVQPLSADDRSTPVGQPFSLGPAPVAADGQARIVSNGLQITGAANPILGTDIEADLELDINLCGDPALLCGSVTGSVTAPLMVDLAGSTFTLTRLEADEPILDQPAIDCAGNVADPI